MDDLEIIDLYFKRSETAVLETDRKYNAFLRRVAYNILRSLQDTEEIVNDTYMGAWNAIPPTRPDSLKHFLSRITRNLSFDRLDYLHAGRDNRTCICFFIRISVQSGSQSPGRVECLPGRI